MMRIKICGITNLTDALFAQESGADALGFIFYKKSKRYIAPEIVKNITSELNPFISKVGVFVNSSADEINSYSALCGLTHVQLHGDEDISFASLINRPVIKALNFSAQLHEEVKVWKNYTLLIDSGDTENRGGTGQTLPWKELTKITGGLRFILAGGLKPANILEAIKITNAAALDVSSGVEKSPGIKDHSLVREFIESAKYELL
ncbi:MAG: phosphoribosylanthranilate isomerase [Calditrichaeota bacterium]|nr:MAG: phosphoribosylanthranilate isomerase [Calditrichota bacterium]MBL1204205.1 phosphoribosylanthranilate isomerase [Calditrichota bacterium]NOG44035.1 phosphoribosylanthranilate isomerase [Calditrichota bacterium]